MELSFKFQEKTYPIVITRKKRKRIAVKIDPSGWIRVSCPEHCSHRTAVKFLEKNRAWLEKALIIHEGMERKLGISACLKFRRTYLFGKPHLLREKPDLKPPYEIREVIYYRGNPRMLWKCPKGQPCLHRRRVREATRFFGSNQTNPSSPSGK